LQGPQSEGATCPFDDTSVDKSGSLKSYSLPEMALNLADLQHAQIRDMILSERPTAEIADVAGCSTRAIYRIHKNLCCFGSTKAPSNGADGPEALSL